MAFLDDYGKAENDPGEWVEAGRDGDRVVKVKVRAIPEELVRTLMRKYTKNAVVVTEGIQTVQPVARDWEDNLSFNLARAVWALVDTENLYVRVRDDEAGQFFAKALGRNDQPFPVDDEVCLDGKWTDPIREHVMRKNGQFRGFVLEVASKVAEESTAKLRKLEGNS